jgi:hypothetical protein
MTKRLNPDQKRALRAATVKQFIQTYERKAQKGIEPNDRRYDRKVESAVKRMKPTDLDRLLHDDEE